MVQYEFVQPRGYANQLRARIGPSIANVVASKIKFADTRADLKAFSGRQSAQCCTNLGSTACRYRSIIKLKRRQSGIDLFWRDT